MTYHTFGVASVKVTSCVQPQTAPMGVILNTSESQIKERRIVEVLTAICSLDLKQTIDINKSITYLHLIV